MNESPQPSVSTGQEEGRAASPHSEPPDRPATPPDGLTAAEVQQRRAQYGYNELPEKKVNPLLKFLSYFWGPIPWMIEAAMILSALVAALGRFRHHPHPAGGQRRRWFLGGVPGRQRHRRPQGQAGAAGQGQARRRPGPRSRPANWCPAT